MYRSTNTREEGEEGWPAAASSTSSVASSSASPTPAAAASSSSSSPLSSPLHFLIEMFPSQPPHTLQNILDEHKGDLEAAVQHCLELESGSHAREAPTATAAASSSSCSASTAATLSFPTPSAPSLQPEEEEEEVDADGVAEAMVSLAPPSQGEAASEDEVEAMQLDEGEAEDKGQIDSWRAEGKETEEQTMEDKPVKEEEQEEESDDEIEILDGPPASSSVASTSPLQRALTALHSLFHSSSSSSSPSLSTPSYLLSLRTLLHCVSNVLQHPTVEKYRLLPLGHSNKFRTKIGGATVATSSPHPLLLQRAKEVLVAVGFKQIGGGADDGGGSKEADSFLLMTNEERQVERLQEARRWIEAEIEQVQKQGGAPDKNTRFLPAGVAAAVAAPAPAATTSALPSAASSSSSPLSAAPSSSSSVDTLLYTPLAQLKKQYKRKGDKPAAPARTPKLSREQMAAKVSQRLQGKPPAEAAASAAASGSASAAAASSSVAMAAPAAPSSSSSAPPPTPTVRAGRVMDLQHMSRLRSEIAAVRRAQHSKWRMATSGRKRVFTVEDLEKMQEEDIKTRAQFGGGGGGGGGGGSSAAGSGSGGGGSKFRTLSDFEAGNPTDCLQLGKDMLRLTNEFRAKQGKPPLQWHQALCDIGMKHSQAMANKQVPFGHAGASDRFRSYPFHAHSAAENVAYSMGIDRDRVAFTHVDGWIHSPGHRKNMLAKHNWCAIAVYKNKEGAYYSTQLFGLG